MSENMRRFKNLVMTLGLVTVLSVGSVLSVFATTIGEVQQNLNQHQNDLNKWQNQIAGLEDEQDILEEQISDLNAEIINTIADGPYLSARTPASHRGRINSVSGVAYTVLRGIFNIAEGRAYDAYGSTAAWGLTIGALTISIALSVWLISRDRARYPRLYEENVIEPTGTAE